MNPPEDPSDRLRLEGIAKSKPRELSTAPDERTALEQSDFERQRQEVLLSGERQDIQERKKYANRNFWLIVSWLIVINGVLLLQGFKVTVLGHSFDLPTSVLLAVVGSTTASVLGIFLIVTNYLFPKK
jgi:predicted anti-sigma-YlaC factor YlaD